LRQKLEDYVDQPSEVDRETWLQELLGRYGWRSVIAAALEDLKHPARVPDLKEHPLVAAKAKQRGRATVNAALWGFLQSHTPESVSLVKYAARRPPFIFSKRNTGEWELLPEWRDDDESVDLVRRLQAGPAATGEAIRRYRVVTFHPAFSYEDFVRGIRPVVVDDENGTTEFRMVPGVFKKICEEARANPAKRYALFIDEINRANIAKVFGELITLIEVDKRIVVDADGRVVQGLEVQLPGSEDVEIADQPFGVPANLDIFGTMNTADRSIALLDVALRRRFEFQEMEPDYTLLQRTIDRVHLGRMLRRINDRLEFWLDRDHRIGHAYLMNAETLDDLRRAFRTQLIPLLQEYFFDELSRVAAILETADAPPFVKRERLAYGELFSTPPRDDAPPERLRYMVTDASTWTVESFAGLYAERPALADTADGD
jgi:5-methylcytosine-specific restriction protein B